ncbi:DUF413 domain-containing protein [Ferrimonas sediminicola]|uniref:Macrodomain Ori protein n=1 Tax=Ferrimonas sediminicola TaxID=2569538 RepID=A0A4U1BBU9_9GAMM|nr:DUF413 domain-containing protein [Ferrimonas sediminicola]TKB48103.1 DUF413 domain-containing protein [Ferrimonas sediminicola]
MSQIEGFQPAGRFFDDKHFPRGFARSGHFTMRESDLLEIYGRRLKALAEGTQSPTTPQEEQFVSMAHGERPAESAVEHAWTKYIAKSQRRKLFTMSSKSPAATDEDEDDSSDDLASEPDDIIELD